MEYEKSKQIPGMFIFRSNLWIMMEKRRDSMQEYELVHEIQNLCPNNQMRDIFFQEVETDDPEEYVRQKLQGKNVSLSTDCREDGTVTVYASCDGLTQKFVFTPI